jgi:hypothetical protein
MYCWICLIHSLAKPEVDPVNISHLTLPVSFQTQILTFVPLFANGFSGKAGHSEFLRLVIILCKGCTRLRRSVSSIKDFPGISSLRSGIPVPH